MRRALTMLAAAAAVVVMTTGLTSCRPTYDVEGTSVSLTLPCGSGTSVDANWYWPKDQDLGGLVWLQHGFSRSKDAVADLTKKYAARGYAVVAPTLASFGSCGINDGAMHTAIATTIAVNGGVLQASFDAARTKVGRPKVTLPGRVVLSGHSAGGAAMTVVAGKLASSPNAPTRAKLAGVVLLDPVENSDNGMKGALPSLASTPLLTISSPAGTCNSNASGTVAVQAARSGFVGVRLPSGCHCDAEADSTDGLCTLVCGTPKQANKDALRRLAVDWAQDMFLGKHDDEEPYPGGTWYEQQKAAGTIVSLTGSA